MNLKFVIFSHLSAKEIQSYSLKFTRFSVWIYLREDVVRKWAHLSPRWREPLGSANCDAPWKRTQLDSMVIMFSFKFSFLSSAPATIGTKITASLSPPREPFCCTWWTTPSSKPSGRISRVARLRAWQGHSSVGIEASLWLDICLSGLPNTLNGR